jgi:hypothetical protein
VAGPATISSRLDRSGYELEVDDTFEAPSLDPRLWVTHYLPHWSSPTRSAARYDVGGGRLELRIDQDQPAWSPEYTGDMRVSSLQSGVFAGPVGSAIGQHRFREALEVRTAQEPKALYTPTYGLFEVRARFSDDPSTMAAMWMIGFEDTPGRSAEICIVEIFGRNVGRDRVGIGMGVHPFHDPSIRDEFSVEQVAIDARQAHWYAATWTSEGIGFYVDDRLVKTVDQSPAYPMQVMLDIFEFRDGDPDHPPGPYPKTFVVERVRAYRPIGTILESGSSAILS